MTNFSINKKVVSGLLLVSFLTVPVVTRATTTTLDYNSLTVQQKIVYLYGQIAILQTLLEMQEDGSSYSSSDSDYETVIVRPGNSSNDIDVETLSATDIREDEADLRGRLDLEDERYATVWFEYGEDDDDLDDRTSRKRLYDSDGEIQSFTANIDNLRDDRRYYYRAVAEDRSGDRDYGQIRSFRTDEDNGVSSSNNDDFSLSVSDTDIDEGDTVEVDWEIPSRDEATNNWIGLYEVGDDNDEYIQWRYLADNDHGTVEFTIWYEGDYEFRLFLDNSYDDEITSREVEVNN